MRHLALAMLLTLLISMVTAVKAANSQTSRPARIGLGLPLTLLKADERSITVKLVPTVNGGATEQTLAIDQKKTKVRIAEVIDQQKTEDGKNIITSKSRPGTLADLRVGQKVQVSAVDDLATDITIMPPPPSPRKKDETK